METELLGKDRCVLAIIDVQNDFCHGDGAYARLGHDVEPMAAVVPHVAKLLESMVAFAWAMGDPWRAERCRPAGPRA